VIQRERPRSHDTPTPWRVVTAVVVVFLLGACTSSNGDGTGDSTETSGAQTGPSFDGSVVPLEVRTSEDYARRMVTCMQDRGWAARVVGPPEEEWQVEYDISPSQDQEWRTAVNDCTDAIGYAGPIEYTDDQLEVLYKFALQVQECLRREGYETSDPPSLSSYVESRGTSWNPYSDLAGEEARPELKERCGRLDLVEAESQ